MRVLHLIQRYYPFRGGSELVFGELAERLMADGHPVTVYTTDAFDLEYFWNGRFRRNEVVSEVIGGLPVVRWPVRHLPLGSLAYPVMRRLMTHLSELAPPGHLAMLDWLGRLSPWLPGLARRLAQDEPAGDFDLVHSANITFESMILAGRDYARRAGVPHVITPFTHLGEPADRRVRKYYSMAHQMALLREADAVIAMTSLERDFLIEQRVPAERIAIIEPGVDPASVTGGEADRLRRRLGLGQAPIIVSIGANAFDKGTVHLVEALRRLWRTGCTAELVIAGARLSHFDRYLTSVPSTERTRLHILGPIDDTTRRDLLAAGSVFAQPSRTDSFGIVYLEAWACGLPVIGARAGGVPAVINDGVNGMLVTFGDVPALAAAIERLLAEPERARLMGEKGRATLVERSWPTVYARTRALYQELLAGRRSHRRRP